MITLAVNLAPASALQWLRIGRRRVSLESVSKSKSGPVKEARKRLLLRGKCLEVSDPAGRDHWRER